MKEAESKGTTEAILKKLVTKKNSALLEKLIVSLRTDPVDESLVHELKAGDAKEDKTEKGTD